MMESLLCIHALHAIYPYYVTLILEGKFRWTTNGVIVQCPSVTPKIVMAVSKEGCEVVVEVVEAKGCPLHKKGERFTLRKQGCL